MIKLQKENIDWTIWSKKAICAQFKISLAGYCFTSGTIQFRNGTGSDIICAEYPNQQRILLLCKISSRMDT